jgi:hypothetical protein
MTKIASHPTEYKGCVYRSRLEATWANFFDLMNWNFQYEPFDLNGWVPDFILIGKKRTTLVEIKPYCSYDEFKENKITNKIDSAMAGDGREVLLLGCTIQKATDWIDATCFGWIGERTWYQDVRACECMQEAILDEFGFFCSTDSYENRISGEYDGDHFVKVIDYEKARVLFSTAQNNTRWNG